jgi:hypothetical protein
MWSIVFMMKKSIFISFIMSLQSVTTVFAADRCQSLESEIKRLEGQQSKVVLSDGKKLEDYKKEKDELLAQTVIIKSLMNIRENYEKYIGNIEAGNVQDLLAGDFKKALEKIDGHQKTIDKYHSLKSAIDLRMDYVTAGSRLAEQSKEIVDEKLDSLITKIDTLFKKNLDEGEKEIKYLKNGGNGILREDELNRNISHIQKAKESLTPKYEQMKETFSEIKELSNKIDTTFSPQEMYLGLARVNLDDSIRGCQDYNAEISDLRIQLKEKFNSLNAPINDITTSNTVLTQDLKKTREANKSIRKELTSIQKMAEKLTSSINEKIKELDKKCTKTNKTFENIDGQGEIKTTIANYGKLMTRMSKDKKGKEIAKSLQEQVDALKTNRDIATKLNNDYQSLTRFNNTLREELVKKQKDLLSDNTNNYFDTVVKRMQKDFDKCKSENKVIESCLARSEESKKILSELNKVQKHLNKSSIKNIIKDSEKDEKLFQKLANNQLDRTVKRLGLILEKKENNNIGEDRLKKILGGIFSKLPECKGIKDLRIDVKNSKHMTCMKSINDKVLKDELKDNREKITELEKKIRARLNKDEKNRIRQIELAKIFLTNDYKKDCGKDLKQVNLTEQGLCFEDRDNKNTERIDALVKTTGDAVSYIMATDFLANLGMDPGTINTKNFKDLRSIQKNLCGKKDSICGSGDTNDCYACKYIKATRDQLEYDDKMVKAAKAKRKYMPIYDPHTDTIKKIKTNGSPVMTHAAMYFAKNLGSFMQPKIGMYGFQTQMQGAYYSGIYNKQMNHWNGQYQQQMWQQWDLSNPNLINGNFNPAGYAF